MRKDQHGCGGVYIEVKKFNGRADHAGEQDLARCVEGGVVHELQVSLDSERMESQFPGECLPSIAKAVWKL